MELTDLIKNELSEGLAEKVPTKANRFGYRIFFPSREKKKRSAAYVEGWASWFTSVGKAEWISVEDWCSVFLGPASPANEWIVRRAVAKIRNRCIDAGVAFITKRVHQTSGLFVACKIVDPREPDEIEMLRSEIERARAGSRHNRELANKLTKALDAALLEG
jgi:hypothetical protein